MKREEVVELFKYWRSAGLKPPASTAEQAEAMLDTFFEQYKNVNSEELAMVREKLAHGQYWPKFGEVDEVLAAVRRAKSGNAKYTPGPAGVEKRNKECREILGGVPGAEGFTQAMAAKCARKFFPDASNEFISENKLLLATQLEQDFHCAACRGMSYKECPNGGYRPFLKVDSKTGLCVPYVDATPCRKVM